MEITTYFYMVTGYSGEMVGMDISSREAPIIAGTDGSSPASGAVEWAVEEARLRNRKLRIIHVFPALVSMVGTTAHDHFADAEAEARREFEAALEKGPPLDGLDAERVLIPGNPAEQLVAASRQASLLVVGSRGIGSFRGMLLGSVSMHCVHHAHCPVVVVRRPD
jgi:nucleotide-binding universal stress UspA family protein